ncbi:MAG TPA: hypothetical protein VH137_10850, partial [Gemmatimonadales bacterium]|nr:hypothetical protein [Gemmatimonadales bacterium]
PAGGARTGAGDGQGRRADRGQRSGRGPGADRGQRAGQGLRGGRGRPTPARGRGTQGQRREAPARGGRGASRAQGSRPPADGAREWWELNEEGTILRGERTGATLRLGDAIEVRVARVEAPRGRVDLVAAG